MEPSEEAKAAAKLKSIEMLYDYTKFHVGVYMTIGTGLIAVFTAKDANSIPVSKTLLVVAIIAFLLAGMAGGVILSALTKTHFTVGSEDFMTSPIGPLGKFKPLYWHAKWYSTLEHSTFWVGVVLTAMAFLISGN